MLGIIGQLARRARSNGELPSDAIERFPHLVFSPLLLALLWEGLFSRMEPLDVDGLLAAHWELLTGGKLPSGRRKR